MSTIEATSSIKGKCIGCEFYQQRHDKDFTIGRCKNEKAPIRRKIPRYFNDKICKLFKRKSV